MIPPDWTPHRREDGELLGWIRQEGADWVAVDVLGRAASAPVQAALEAGDFAAAGKALGEGWAGVEQVEVLSAGFDAAYAGLPDAGYGKLGLVEAAMSENKAIAALVRDAGGPKLGLATPMFQRGKTAADKPAKDTPARKRDQPRERKPGEAPVLVHAKARYVRTSARKARLVCDHIRGKDVEQARAILSFTPRGAAKPWMKLLESAIANAEHNHELVGDELKIASVHADEGPTLKRYRPRAMGRATRIRKRTAHLTIELTPKES